MYSAVVLGQTTVITPDLTEASLVIIGATYWMGSLKEPG